MTLTINSCNTSDTQTKAQECLAIARFLTSAEKCLCSEVVRLSQPQEVPGSRRDFVQVYSWSWNVPSVPGATDGNRVTPLYLRLRAVPLNFLIPNMTSTSAVNTLDELNASDESTEEADTPYNPKELAALVKVTPHTTTCTHFLTWFTLQKLQIENSGFRQQLRQFTSGSISGVSSPGSDATPSTPLEKHGDEIDQLGRFFCILNEIWVRPSHLRQPYPEHLRNVGPRHPGHYGNDRAKHDGVVAELYDFIPPHFHVFLEGSKSFSDKVCVTGIPQTTSPLTYSSLSLEQNQ